MNRFDERMKQRAQQEEMRLDPVMEERMEEKLYSAEEPKKKKELEVNIMALYAVLGGVAAALILMLAFLSQPKDDSMLGVLPNETHLPQLIPVTQGKLDEQPVVSADVAFSGNAIQMTAWLENPVDDDIWLIDWQPSLEGAEDQPKRQLIWLEPGAMFTQTYEWKDQAADQVNVRCRYTAYRVTAHTLHWMEDEALLQDAFEAGALILQPGEWANGQAGEMQLPLPEGQTDDPISYYIKKGMLTEGFSADEVLRAEKQP